MKRGAAFIAVGVAWLCLATAPVAGRPAVAAESADETFIDLERRLQHLEKRLETLRAEARTRLAEQRRVLRRKLAEMRARSEAAWQGLRPELERELEDLRKAIEGGRSEPELTRT